MSSLRPSPPPSAPDAGPPEVLRQAAEWVALRQAGPLAAGKQARLDEWCAADPRHAAALAEVEAASRTFDQLAFYPHKLEGAPDPDLLGRPRKSRTAWLLPAAAAAAAVVALAAWWPRRAFPTAPAGPTVVAASSHFHLLPDGSRVELNSGAEVAEHFTTAERRIRLVRGEAHFEVAKNPLRPFIVEADNVAVRAVGTAFDVRMGATGIDVLVTEGKVGVTTGAAPPPAAGPANAGGPSLLGPGLILSAGQRTVVPTAPAEPPALVVETLTQHQIDRALAWQTSRLVFEDMPLAAVAEKFNAAAQSGDATVRLRVEGRALQAMRISGRVRSDSVEDFVATLADDFGVTTERRGNEIILRRAP